MILLEEEKAWLDTVKLYNRNEIEWFSLYKNGELTAEEAKERMFATGWEKFCLVLEDFVRKYNFEPERVKEYLVAPVEVKS